MAKKKKRSWTELALKVLGPARLEKAKREAAKAAAELSSKKPAHRS